MKISSLIFTLVTGVFLHLTLAQGRAEETLWNLSFKDIKPGSAPAEVAYTAGCTGPQKVATDGQNTLVGAKALGPLKDALVFEKASGSAYLPALTLKGTTPINSGVVTVNLDVEFDRITPTADHPIETLMAFPIINGDGGTTYIPTMACTGPGNVLLAAAGLVKGKTPVTFTTGAVAHFKAVLDLDKHTFQIFINDQPMADAEHDDAKFSSFLGMTIRDGTALGGNKGTTFTAGLANIVITHH